MFNMGVGFCVVVSPAGAAEVTRTLGGAAAGCTALGEARADGKGEVRLLAQGLVGRRDVGFTKVDR